MYLKHNMQRQLSEFVCAFHPATNPGSSPKHPIYTFIILQSNLCLYLSLHCKRTKINKRTPGVAHFFKKRPCQCQVPFTKTLYSSLHVTCEHCEHCLTNGQRQKFPTAGRWQRYSWLSGQSRHQQSTIRIPSSANCK